MTVDPIISEFLREGAARAAALPTAVSPAESRAQLDAMGDELFAEVAEGMPDGVAIDDIVIPGSSGGIPARVYRSASGGGAGVHILIHGGGSWQGSIRDWISDVQAAERATRVPCTVVTIEYRLAPEHPFPAGLDDVVDSIRWILGNAAALGDTAHSDTGLSARRGAGVSIGGVSAGANLAAAALLYLRDEGGALPGFAIFEAGVFDLDLDYDSYRKYAEGFGLETAVMPGLIGMYLTDPALIANPYVSPVRATVLDGFPSSHFVTAEFDPTRDTSDAFADKLENAGVSVTRSLRRGHTHQSPVMTKVLPATREWRADVLAALQTFHQETHEGDKV